MLWVIIALVVAFLVAISNAVSDDVPQERRERLYMIAAALALITIALFAAAEINGWFS